MATAPKPGARQQAEADKIAITVKLDGNAYTFRMSEVSALDTGTLRRATGMSLSKIMQCALEDPDIDVVSALVWLARRQNGEPKLTYGAVAGELGYDSEFDLETEEVEAPEA